MLVDANILLYAVDSESRFHAPAREWLESALNGTRRVGLPWATLHSFVRISTHPRAQREPLTPEQAWDHVQEWLDAPMTWVPAPGRAHRELLGRLIADLDLRSNLVADATLAALCLEHGLTMVSADSDFARFTEIEWINPIQR
jgi:toxin-antitoxin system PIN domain toxin